MNVYNKVGLDIKFSCLIIVMLKVMEVINYVWIPFYMHSTVLLEIHRDVSL